MKLLPLLLVALLTGCGTTTGVRITADTPAHTQLARDCQEIARDILEGKTGERPPKTSLQIINVPPVDCWQEACWAVDPAGGLSSAWWMPGTKNIYLVTQFDGNYTQEAQALLVHEIAHIWVHKGAKRLGGEGVYTEDHPPEFRHSFIRWYSQ